MSEIPLLGVDSALIPFYSICMDAEMSIFRLEEEVRAQVTLLMVCRDRAVVALGNPRLCSAWIGHFVRLSNAMAATGSAIAALRHADGDAAVPAFRLPALPRLPEEGEGVPSKFCKTTARRI